MERDIRSLEDDLQAKMAPLKLVHTRLENRTKRPGVDLCRDEVGYTWTGTGSFTAIFNRFCGRENTVL